MRTEGCAEGTGMACLLLTGSQRESDSRLRIQTTMRQMEDGQAGKGKALVEGMVPLR